MIEYDQTFNPNVLIGHYDLIAWFSDFALYLGPALGYRSGLALRLTKVRSSRARCPATALIHTLC